MKPGPATSNLLIPISNFAFSKSGVFKILSSSSATFFGVWLFSLARFNAILVAKSPCSLFLVRENSIFLTSIEVNWPVDLALCKTELKRLVSAATCGSELFELLLTCTRLPLGVRITWMIWKRKVTAVIYAIPREW